jgi:hypothetical protein
LNYLKEPLYYILKKTALWGRKKRVIAWIQAA